jgi:ABC-type transport system involved in cytochrome c biogenesis permease subunit
VAFLLLTVSIVMGFILVRRVGGGEEWILDPKVVATAVLWVVLAVFVHLRASSDRHGRGIALVAVFGLGCLLFAFMGVHLVAPSLHTFIQMGHKVVGL